MNKTLKILKSKTRNSRIQIQYKLEDDTNIENITSEKLLSHVNTKKDFTKYLSCKIAQVFSAAEKRYIVACSITAESNIVDFPDKLKFHSREEADTLIVLQSTDVAKSNPFCLLYVVCSDTDVLLLLLHVYPQICNNTIFHAITREVDIGCAYSALGTKKSKALLGVYAFTGCDLTGGFTGFSKNHLDTLRAIQSYIKSIHFIGK